MTTPITGPFSKSEYLLGAPTSLGFKPRHYDAYRSWYRQKRPYNLPLSFTYRAAFVTAFNAGPLSGSAYAQTSSDGEAFPSGNSASDFPSAYNRAYGKFKSMAVPSSAGLGIALAQRKQAMDMIEKRAYQLADLALMLRKKSLLEQVMQTGINKRNAKKKSKKSRWKKRSKTFADTWLEYSFGWAPLVSDMYNAIDVLQGSVELIPCEGRATQTIPIRVRGPNVDISIPEPGYTLDGTKRGTWKIHADVTVTNPNLNLANQLGLVNPASVIWDAIPFSFVVGWFVNVDQFLSSFTDFWGMTLSNPYRTFFYQKQQTETFYRTRDITVGTKSVRIKILNYTWSLSKIACYRMPGSIPGPTLRFKEPWILKPARAANAISLLIQRLR